MPETNCQTAGSTASQKHRRISIFKILKGKSKIFKGKSILNGNTRT